DGTLLYVVNENDSAVTVIDVASSRIVKKIQVGTEPETAVASPDGRWVAVSNETSNDIHVIDTAAQAVVKKIPVPKNPRGMRFTADSRRPFVGCEPAHAGGASRSSRSGERAPAVTSTSAVAPRQFDLTAASCGAIRYAAARVRMSAVSRVRAERSAPMRKWLSVGRAALLFVLVLLFVAPPLASGQTAGLNRLQNEDPNNW